MIEDENIQIMVSILEHHMSLVPDTVDKERIRYDFFEAMGWFRRRPDDVTVAQIMNWLGATYYPVSACEESGVSPAELIPVYSLPRDFYSRLSCKRLSDYDRKPLQPFEDALLKSEKDGPLYPSLLDRVHFSDERSWFFRRLDYETFWILARPEDTTLPFAWCWLTARRLINRWNEERSRPRPPKKSNKATSQGNPPKRTKRNRKKKALTLQDLADITKKEYCGLPCYSVDKDKGFHMHGPFRGLLHLERCLFSVEDVQAYEEQNAEELFTDTRQAERLFCRDKARQLVWENPDIRSGDAARIIAETSPGKSLPDEKTIQNHILNIMNNHKSGPCPKTK